MAATNVKTALTLLSSSTASLPAENKMPKRRPDKSTGIESPKNRRYSALDIFGLYKNSKKEQRKSKFYALDNLAQSVVTVVDSVSALSALIRVPVLNLIQVSEPVGDLDSERTLPFYDDCNNLLPERDASPVQLFRASLLRKKVIRRKLHDQRPKSCHDQLLSPNATFKDRPQLPPGGQNISAEDLLSEASAQTGIQPSDADLSPWPVIAVDDDPVGPLNRHSSLKQPFGVSTVDDIKPTASGAAAAAFPMSTGCLEVATLLLFPDQLDCDIRRHFHQYSAQFLSQN